ncbi:MAG: MFS transporter [Methanomassiliicoccales archaeon]|nr:MAG: MFS transporter [Methanomassiliicoccales archaeon]
MSSPKDKRYKWKVLVIACIGSMMGPLDSSIIGVSLPEISRSLSMDYASVIWVPTAYLVTIASLLLSAGRLSDMRGRKWLYIVGFGTFTLGSLACSISMDGPQLIVSRVVQGVGGALMMAIAPAMITATFPNEERGKALGINALFVYLGLSFGPPLGGLLTNAFGWRSIFLVNIPIGITVMALSALVIQDDSRRIEGRFDVKGAALFSVALISFLISLTFAEDIGWTSPFILIGLSIALLAGTAYCIVEVGLGDNAMLNFALVTKNRLFAMANLSALMNYTAFFGTSFIISFYLQRVLGASLVETGAVLLSMPISMAIIAPMSGWLSDKWGSRALATGGMLLMSIGLLMLSTLNGQSDIWTVTVFLITVGIGMGMFASPNTSAIMGSVRKDQLGQASGTLSTMRTVGQSLSLVVMGAVISAFSSPDIVTSVFRGSIGSTVELEGFIEGMRAAFLVCAFIGLTGALVSSVRGGTENVGLGVDEVKGRAS